MEKRLLLAVAMSLLIMLTWSGLMSKFYPIDKQKVTEKIPLSSLDLTKIPPLNREKLDQDAKLERVDLDRQECIFALPYATLKEALFKDYQNYPFSLQQGFEIKDKSLTFQVKNLGRESTFIYTDQKKRIFKRFIFHNSNYSIELEIKVQNLSPAPLKFSLPLVVGVLNFGQGKPYAYFQDVAFSDKNKILHFNGRKEVTFNDMKFLGIRDRFFCVIIEPGSEGYASYIKKLNPIESEIGLISQEIVLIPGQEIAEKFHIYLGPQDLKLIKSIKPEWSAIISYGTFDVVAQVLVKILNFIYRLVKNWGLAIILLTMLIQIILYPLTLKQLRAQKEMQALQPHIEELRRLYKDNPQRFQREQLELFRKHKVNPFGGCLPLFLQMPLFIALYQVQNRFIYFKNARFFWIKDLSEPDRLVALPWSLPILGMNKGFDINILPILMAILMIVQLKISTAKVSKEVAEQQKIMSLMFPVMLLVFLYRASAAFNLYMFTNNLLMLFSQARINKVK